MQSMSCRACRDVSLCVLLCVSCSEELEADVEVNYLECDDSSGYLIFNKEVHE